MFYPTQHSSSVGTITPTSDGNSPVDLWIQGQKYFGSSATQAMIKSSDLPIFATIKEWLDKYFSGQKSAIAELLLAPNRSNFRRAVWEVLCEIPYDEVIAYGEVTKKMAARINQKYMLAQAIDGAMGHNPISIVIPCHRVVGSNNSLTGYAGGIDKEIRLLGHKSADLSKLFIPIEGSVFW